MRYLWMFWVLVLVAVAGLALIVGAFFHSARRRLPRTANFEIYRGEL